MTNHSILLESKNNHCLQAQTGGHFPHITVNNATDDLFHDIWSFIVLFDMSLSNLNWINFIF